MPIDIYTDPWFIVWTGIHRWDLLHVSKERAYHLTGIDREVPVKPSYGCEDQDAASSCMEAGSLIIVFP